MGHKSFPAPTPALPPPAEVIPFLHRQPQAAPDVDTLALVDRIIRAPETPNLFPEIVVQGISEWARCALVRLWSYCPSQSALTLVASHPTTFKPHVLSAHHSLSGAVVDSQCVKHYPDVTARFGDRHFDSPELISQFKLQNLLSVPIHNRYNPNHVEFILNLFNTSRPVPLPALIDTLEWIAEYIAQAAERILADRCTEATGAVHEQFALCPSKDQLLRECLRIALGAVEGEAASIFLESHGGDHLELAASTTEVEWSGRLADSKRWVERGAGRLGTVWQENVEYIGPGGAPQELSREKVPGPVGGMLIVPINDYSGKAIGAIRCTNKLPRAQWAREPRSFGQEDATVLQAVSDALVPRLLLLRGEEHTRLMLTKLTHELKTPIGGINAQLDFIESEADHQKVRFSEDWIQEARDNVTLMAGLVENAEAAIRYTGPPSKEEPYTQVLIMRDIIIPAIDQMASMLRRNGLPTRSMSYDGLKVVPPIYVKRNALRQVVYNLLSNSIKYRYKDASVFNVEIVACEKSPHYLLRFRDWGPGVTEEDAKRIFSLGVRGTQAHRYDVSGRGYGLYISREIMRAHGGDLVLTNLHQPTEFTLFLPSRLLWKPH
jgi:signal transduction histidine kinase